MVTHFAANQVTPPGGSPSGGSRRGKIHCPQSRGHGAHVWAHVSQLRRTREDAEKFNAPRLPNEVPE